MNGIGGLAGWRWIFVQNFNAIAMARNTYAYLQVLEGLATMLIGGVAACLLPTDIASAKFLTEEERALAGACTTGLLRC